MSQTYSVVAQPDFESPEVVSVFDAEMAAPLRCAPCSWVDTDDEEEIRELVAECLAKGARPTGDYTREFLPKGGAK